MTNSFSIASGSPGGDGGVRGGSDTSWAAARALADGDLAQPTNSNESWAVYSANNDGSAKLYTIWRGFFAFDTSSLPDDAVIVGVTLRVYVVGKWTGAGGGVAVVSGSQAVPITTADFDQVGSTAFATTTLAALNVLAYNDFVLDSNGWAQVNRTGVTKYALRTTLDLNNTAPGNTQYCGFTTYYYEHDAGVVPEIIVYWNDAAGTIQKSSFDAASAVEGSSLSTPSGQQVTSGDSASATEGTSVVVSLPASGSGGGGTPGTLKYDSFDGTANTLLESHTETTPSPGTSGNYHVWEPTGYVSGQAVPLLVLFHSAGGTDDDPFGSNGTPLIANAQAAGYLCVSTLAQDRAWGNPLSVENYYDLIAWAKANYDVTRTILWAASMGGLAAFNIAAGGRVTDLKGVLAIYPVVSLTNFYTDMPSYQSEINSAYGGAVSYPGNDPYLRSAAAFTGKRFRFYHSAADTTSSKTRQTDLMHAKVNPVAAESVVVTTSGNHGDASNWVWSEFAAFFGRCV